MKLTYCFLLACLSQVSACNDLCKLHLHSPPGAIYYNYFPFNNNRIEFQIRSAGAVRILLANDYAPKMNPNYEIIIGTQGTYNVKIFRDGNLLAQKDGPIFDPTTFRAFSVTTKNGVITLRTNIEGEVIAQIDYIYVPTRILGIATDSNISAEILYDCEQFLGTCG